MARASSDDSETLELTLEANAGNREPPYNCEFSKLTSTWSTGKERLKQMLMGESCTFCNELKHRKFLLHQVKIRAAV